MPIPTDVNQNPQKKTEGDASVLDQVDKAQKLLKTAGKVYDEKFVKRADRMANMFQVNHYFDEQKGRTLKADRDRVKVAYPYSNTTQIVAEIYTGLPDVIVKTEKRNVKDQQGNVVIDYTEGAKTLKQCIDYVKRKSNLEEQADRMVIDGVATGIGCIQLVAQKTTKVPKFIRKLYRDVIYDAANVSDIYDSSWIACKLVRELDDIKKDDRYDPHNRDRVNAAKLDETIYGNSEIKYGVLWEFFDKKNDLYLVFPDDQKFALYSSKLSDMYKFKVESDDFVTDWPFTFFINEQEILTANGMGDIYPIEASVRELDKTRTQQINHRKRFNRKYLVKSGVLDAKGMNSLRNPEDGTIIEHKSANPTSDIAVLQDAPLSGDVYKTSIEIDQDIQKTSPLGPNSLVHGVGKSPSTLGESQIVEQSSNTRLARKQKALGKTFNRLYRMIAEYIQQYWVDTDMFLVTGNGNKDEDWLHYDPQKVEGEFSYEIVPESMRDNTVVYRQQLSTALQVVIPLLRLAFASPSVAIMVRKYLATFETLKNDVDDIVPAKYAAVGQGSLSPIPTETIRMNIAVEKFPIGVQAKILNQGGVQVDASDFQTIPGTSSPTNPGDPLQELEQIIGGGNHQELLDALNKMPQNEKEAIMSAISHIHQQGGQPAAPASSPSVPTSNSTPTNASITQGATAIR